MRRSYLGTNHTQSFRRKTKIHEGLQSQSRDFDRPSPSPSLVGLVPRWLQTPRTQGSRRVASRRIAASGTILFTGGRGPPEHPNYYAIASSKLGSRYKTSDPAGVVSHPTPPRPRKASALQKESHRGPWLTSPTEHLPR